MQTIRLSENELEAQAQQLKGQLLYNTLGPHIASLGQLFGVEALQVVPYIASLLPDNELFLVSEGNTLVALIALNVGARRGLIEIARIQRFDLSVCLAQVADIAFTAGMHKVYVETTDRQDSEELFNAGFGMAGVRKAEVLIAGQPVDMLLLERLCPELQQFLARETPQEEERSAERSANPPVQTPKITPEQSKANAKLTAADEEDGERYEVIETVKME